MNSRLLIHPLCVRAGKTTCQGYANRAYRIYINARNFWRSKKEFEFTRQELQSILTDVKLAAEQGDWGGRALLAHFHLRGLGHLDTNKVLDSEPEKGVQIARQAATAGQAWGYYDLGVAHEHGYGGAAMNEAISWAYYRRAAELGSPDAQMTLAEAYENAKRPAEALSLRMCAYKQEHGPAAMFLGREAKLRGEYSQALKYYQDGARFGDKEAAAALMLFFGATRWNVYSSEHKNKLRELGLKPDAEREDRYDQVLAALELNPDLRLKLLDNVVPLPPAKLPSWTGVLGAIAPEQDELPSYRSSLLNKFDATDRDEETMKDTIHTELHSAVKRTRQLLGRGYDALLQAFIVELERYRTLIDDHWPLTPEERTTVDIGRVAVRELDNVFPDYVTQLSELGAKLRSPY